MLPGKTYVAATPPAFDPNTAAGVNRYAMGLDRDISDAMWSASPSFCVNLLEAARRIGWTPQILQCLEYQSEYFSGEPTFPCWWFRNPLPGNAGDLLTPFLLQGLFGLSPRFSNKREFLGVGSIAKHARPYTVVWGTGMMSRDTVVNPGPVFLAVRGPLSRDALMHQGHTVPEVYGDPAILLPLLHRPTDVSVEQRRGFIPHFMHHSLRHGLTDSIRFIDVLRGSKSGLLAFIDEILACEMIFSSSLHGLIIAVAYGKPVAWIRHPGKLLRGDDFKFRDFFASIGIDNPRCYDVEQAADLNALDLEHTYRAEIPESMRTGLIEGFRAHYGLNTPSSLPYRGRP